MRILALMLDWPDLREQFRMIVVMRAFAWIRKAMWERTPAATPGNGSSRSFFGFA